MNIIKWIALRRFNYIDSAGQVTMALAIYEGHWTICVMVFLITVIASVTVEAMASTPETTPCQKK